jgi:hypothetical protein
MNRARHGIEKAGIRIGSEVHGNGRGGCDRPDHFDVEHDFTVGTIHIPGGGVFAVVHGDRRYLGGPHAKACEVRYQVRSAISAAELDDGNALTCARSAGKAVQGCHLRWTVRNRSRRLGLLILGVILGPHSEMRFGLRPIIQTHDRLDDSVQFLREQDGSRAATIGAARMRELLHLHRECIAELLHRAG